MTQRPDKDFSRLPKWAQQYIANLEMERETAINALNEWVDDQTEGPIYSDEFICTGEESGPSVKRRYFDCHHLTIERDNVQLSILLPLEREGIELSWGNPTNLMRELALIPKGFQQVVIKETFTGISKSFLNLIEKNKDLDLALKFLRGSQVS